MLSLFIFFLVAISLAFAFWYFRNKAKKNLQNRNLFNQTPSKAFFEHSIKDADFFSKKPEWNKQNAEWQRDMLHTGQRLIDAGVDRITLIHGTFVGSDPLGVKETFSRFSKKNNLKAPPPASLTLGQRLIKDYGHFTPEYATLIEKSCQDQIPCQRFVWNSENHHYARTTATLRLIQTLATNHANHEKKLLFIAHSHGGQILALLSKMIHDHKWVGWLQQHLSAADYDWQCINECLSQLRSKTLYFVTMGTPVRYQWHLKSNIHLLHLVNHRGDPFVSMSVQNILNTAQGDYIQLWGSLGSDSLTLKPKEIEFNTKVLPWLGPGVDPSYFLQNFSSQNRQLFEGSALLIDYLDQSSKANFIQSGLGHAAYTKYEFLRYNMNIIAHYFFEQTETLNE